ncbi:MAG: hypothetical protein ABIQ59_05575 [Nocardioidaceae bacterium]
MNEDTVKLDTRPEVTAFVAAVRGRLADLTEEEREELLGGLEADLSERLAEGVSEHGGDLGDPAAYAAELRAAAGLEARPRRWKVRRPGKPFPEEVTSLLDDIRRQWDRLTARHPWGVEGSRVAAALRPAWWVLRAWLAVELLDLGLGPSEYLTVVPSLGNQVVGVAVLLVAVAVSALVGTGRLWVDVHAPEQWLGRLVLLALNTFAIVIALPLVLGGFPGAWDSHRLSNGSIYNDGRQSFPPGLRDGNHLVRNVFAYDAQGNLLTGVQLYDQKGRPLAVNQDPYLGSYRDAGSTVRTYPWFNGDQKLFNVFPLPVREQGRLEPVRDPWSTSRPPALPTGPLAVVPPAALPSPEAAVPQVSPSSSPSSSPSADSEKPRRR